MPPKKTSPPLSGDSVPSSAPQGLTEGELRFIKAVFDNMTQKPDADWDAVAAALTLKDAKCAKERFRQMSVRHGWRNDSSPRKKAAAAAGGAASEGKVARKPRAPRKKAVKKDEDQDESEDKVDAKAEVKDEGSD